MEWNEIFFELLKAYHLDGAYDRITNLSIGVPSNTAILLSCILLYPVAKAIYNIYFHPLSKYPGPVLAKATKIPVALVSWEGSFSQWMSDLHNYYRSDVVRISPDELSFIDSSAWKDIYGIRPIGGAFPKDLSAFPGVKSIVTANDADHSRYRRLLAHGFSDKALREQEDLIQAYIGNLMSGLKDTIPKSKGKANLVDWFNWTMFDIITDLSFGESFKCLEEHKYHPWISLLVQGTKSVSLRHVTTRFPPLGGLLSLYIPTKFKQARKDYLSISKEVVERRLEMGGDTRPDFVGYTLRHNGEKDGMTREEIRENMSTLIGAGSDTTASALSAAVWYLLNYPPGLEEVNAEVRGRFKRFQDINLQAVSSDLPYLQAVIDETFRLHPPAPSAQPRLAPKGGHMVSGHWVPEGTQVKLSQYAANHSLLNFNQPEAFAPPRWLGDPHFARDKTEVVQPFSIGARNCIGKKLALAEIRLTLAHLLWTFDMELADETDKEWAKQKGWMAWERPPLYVSLKVREV